MPVPLLLLALAFAFVGPGRSAGGAETEAEDACIACHRDPDFLVENKKLYDYFQQWDGSIHGREGVSCDECHGGDPKTAQKDKAHGEGVAASDTSSGIHYRNIARTCGKCHEDILEGFQKSDHFEHVAAKGEDKQGPTCVTCHGSIDAEILDVNSVEATCARCHNLETDNNPEIPEKARYVLNKFLSIHRFDRYITTRAEPDDASEFFADLDPKLRRLSVTWHTFDLDAIEASTAEVLDVLKAKRDEIRRNRAEAN
jgi:nitrate/TMAO reductase-like tetraheme cytochrome c subunit